MGKIGDLIIAVGYDLKGLSKGLKQAERKMQRTAQRLNRIGDNISANVSLPIIGVGVAAVKSAADMEALETRLITLTGSVEKGKKAFEDLVAFSKKTPFRIQDLIDAESMMLAAGESVEQAAASLQYLGDIAAATGAPLKALTLVMSQAKAIGAAYTMDLRQLANRGIPVFEMLKQHLQITGAELEKFIREGKVSYELLSEVLRKSTQEGGLYADGMVRASKTIWGQFSTLADNMKIAMAEIGKAIVENIDLKALIDKTTKSIIKAVKWFGNLSPAVKRSAVAISLLVAAIGPLFKIASGVRMVLAAVTSIFSLMVSPIGIVVVAIGALTAGFIHLYNNSETFRGGVTGVIAVLKELGKAAKIAFFAITGQFQKAAEASASLNLNLKEVYRTARDAAGSLRIEPKVMFDKDEIERSFNEAVKSVSFKPITAQMPEIGGGGVEASSSEASGRSTVEQIQKLGEQARWTADEIAEALLPVAPQIDEAFASALSAVEQRVVALHNRIADIPEAFSMMTVAEGFIYRLGDAFDFMAKRIKAMTASISVVDMLRTFFEGMGDAALVAGKAMADSAMQGVKSLKELGKAALRAAADVVRAKIIEGVAAVVSDALKKFGIVGIAIGAALGATAGAMFNTVLNKISPPKLAEGGIAYGPTLAVVGDNPGARTNPEVIAPLDQLNKIIGSARKDAVKIVGDFRIKGSDLVLVLDEAYQTREFSV